MASKQWHLVSYDVRDPKRLRQVAKVLESYGSRLQYSVFRCRLDVEMLERLHWQLSQIMEDVDDLLVIPLVQPLRRAGAGAFHGRPIELGRAAAHVQNRVKGQSWTAAWWRRIAANRRRNVLASIDNASCRPSGRCLTIAAASA